MFSLPAEVCRDLVGVEVHLSASDTPDFSMRMRQRV
jgi:hypothetical protein